VVKPPRDEAMFMTLNIGSAILEGLHELKAEYLEATWKNRRDMINICEWVVRPAAPRGLDFPESLQGDIVVQDSRPFYSNEAIDYRRRTMQCLI
jgi:hypothetical protein